MDSPKVGEPKLYRYYDRFLLSAHSIRHAYSILREYNTAADMRRWPPRVKQVPNRAKVMLSCDGETLEAFTAKQCARFHYPGLVPEW